MVIVRVLAQLARAPLSKGEVDGSSPSHSTDPGTSYVYGISVIGATHEKKLCGNGKRNLKLTVKFNILQGVESTKIRYI